MKFIKLIYLAGSSHLHHPIYKPNGGIQMSEEEFMNTVVREMLNGTIPDDVIYGGIFDNKIVVQEYIT